MIEHIYHGIHTFPDLVQTHVNHNHLSVDAMTPRTTRLNDIQQTHCGHKPQRSQITADTNSPKPPRSQTIADTNNRDHKLAAITNHRDHKLSRSQTIAITNHRGIRDGYSAASAITNHRGIRDGYSAASAITNHPAIGIVVQVSFVGGNGNGNASLKQEWICR